MIMNTIYFDHFPNKIKTSPVIISSHREASLVELPPNKSVNWLPLVKLAYEGRARLPSIRERVRIL